MNFNVKFLCFILYLMLSVFKETKQTTINDLNRKTRANDDPMLLKILNSVDAAVSDKHLFNVTIKLLRSLCMCMSKTLKKKESALFDGPTNRLAESNYIGKKTDAIKLYQKIYSHTCLDLQSALINNISNGHNNYSNEPKQLNNNVKKSNNALDDSIHQNLNVIKSDKKIDLLFDILIKDQSLHKYNIQQHSILKNSLSSVSSLENSVIIMFTLYLSQLNVSFPKNKTAEISELDLNIIENNYFPINIDIFDTRKNAYKQNRESSVKRCHLYSMYFFIKEHLKKKMIKLFRIFHKNNTVIVYIDIKANWNNDNLTEMCCKNKSVELNCERKAYVNKSHVFEVNSTDNDSKVRKYQDIILNIKQLVTRYSEKLKQENSFINSTSCNTECLTSNKSDFSDKENINLDENLLQPKQYVWFDFKKNYQNFLNSKNRLSYFTRLEFTTPDNFNRSKKLKSKSHVLQNISSKTTESNIYDDFQLKSNNINISTLRYNIPKSRTTIIGTYESYNRDNFHLLNDFNKLNDLMKNTIRTEDEAENISFVPPPYFHIEKVKKINMPWQNKYQTKEENETELLESLKTYTSKTMKMTNTFKSFLQTNNPYSSQVVFEENYNTEKDNMTVYEHEKSNEIILTTTNNPHILESDIFYARKKSTIESFRASNLHMVKKIAKNQSTVTLQKTMSPISSFLDLRTTRRLVDSSAEKIHLPFSINVTKSPLKLNVLSNKIGTKLFFDKRNKYFTTAKYDIKEYISKSKFLQLPTQTTTESFLDELSTVFKVNEVKVAGVLVKKYKEINRTHTLNRKIQTINPLNNNWKNTSIFKLTEMPKFQERVLNGNISPTRKNLGDSTLIFKNAFTENFSVTENLQKGTISSTVSITTRFTDTDNKFLLINKYGPEIIPLGNKSHFNDFTTKVYQLEKPYLLKPKENKTYDGKFDEIEVFGLSTQEKILKNKIKKNKSKLEELDKVDQMSVPQQANLSIFLGKNASKNVTTKISDAFKIYINKTTKKNRNKMNGDSILTIPKETEHKKSDVQKSINDSRSRRVLQTTTGTTLNFTALKNQSLWSTYISYHLNQSTSEKPLNTIKCKLSTSNMRIENKITNLTITNLFLDQINKAKEKVLIQHFNFTSQSGSLLTKNISNQFLNKSIVNENLIDTANNLLVKPNKIERTPAIDTSTITPFILNDLVKLTNFKSSEMSDILPPRFKFGDSTTINKNEFTKNIILNGKIENNTFSNNIKHGKRSQSAVNTYLITKKSLIQEKSSDENVNRNLTTKINPDKNITRLKVNNPLIHWKIDFEQPKINLPIVSNYQNLNDIMSYEQKRHNIQKSTVYNQNIDSVYTSTHYTLIKQNISKLFETQDSNIWQDLKKYISVKQQQQTISPMPCIFDKDPQESTRRSFSKSPIKNISTILPEMLYGADEVHLLSKKQKTNETYITDIPNYSKQFFNFLKKNKSTFNINKKIQQLKHNLKSTSLAKNIFKEVIRKNVSSANINVIKENYPRKTTNDILFMNKHFTKFITLDDELYSSYTPSSKMYLFANITTKNKKILPKRIIDIITTTKYLVLNEKEIYDHSKNKKLLSSYVTNIRNNLHNISSQIKKVSLPPIELTSYIFNGTIKNYTINLPFTSHLNKTFNKTFFQMENKIQSIPASIRYVSLETSTIKINTDCLTDTTNCTSESLLTQIRSIYPKTLTTLISNNALLMPKTQFYETKINKNHRIKQTNRRNTTSIFNKLPEIKQLSYIHDTTTIHMFKPTLKKEKLVNNFYKTKDKPTATEINKSLNYHFSKLLINSTTNQKIDLQQEINQGESADIALKIPRKNKLNTSSNAYEITDKINNIFKSNATLQFLQDSYSLQHYTTRTLYNLNKELGSQNKIITNKTHNIKIIKNDKSKTNESKSGTTETKAPLNIDLKTINNRSITTTEREYISSPNTAIYLKETRSFKRKENTTAKMLFTPNNESKGTSKKTDVTPNTSLKTINNISVTATELGYILEPYTTMDVNKINFFKRDVKTSTKILFSPNNESIGKITKTNITPNTNVKSISNVSAIMTEWKYIPNPNTTFDVSELKSPKSNENAQNRIPFTHNNELKGATTKTYVSTHTRLKIINNRNITATELDKISSSNVSSELKKMQLSKLFTQNNELKGVTTREIIFPNLGFKIINNKSINPTQWEYISRPHTRNSVNKMTTSKHDLKTLLKELFTLNNESKDRITKTNVTPNISLRTNRSITTTELMNVLSPNKIIEVKENKYLERKVKTQIKMPSPSNNDLKAETLIINITPNTSLKTISKTNITTTAWGYNSLPYTNGIELKPFTYGRINIKTSSQYHDNEKEMKSLKHDLQTQAEKTNTLNNESKTILTPNISLEITSNMNITTTEQEFFIPSPDTGIDMKKMKSLKHDIITQSEMPFTSNNIPKDKTTTFQKNSSEASQKILLNKKSQTKRLSKMFSHKEPNVHKKTRVSLSSININNKSNVTRSVIVNYPFKSSLKICTFSTQATNIIVKNILPIDSVTYLPLTKQFSYTSTLNGITTERSTPKIPSIRLENFTHYYQNHNFPTPNYNGNEGVKRVAKKIAKTLSPDVSKSDQTDDSNRFSALAGNQSIFNPNIPSPSRTKTTTQLLENQNYFPNMYPELSILDKNKMETYINGDEDKITNELSTDDGKMTAIFDNYNYHQFKNTNKLISIKNSDCKLYQTIAPNQIFRNNDKNQIKLLNIPVKVFENIQLTERATLNNSNVGNSKDPKLKLSALIENRFTLNSNNSLKQSTKIVPDFSRDLDLSISPILATTESGIIYKHFIDLYNSEKGTIFNVTTSTRNQNNYLFTINNMSEKNVSNDLRNKTKLLMENLTPQRPMGTTSITLNYNQNIITPFLTQNSETYNKTKSKIYIMKTLPVTKPTSTISKTPYIKNLNLNYNHNNKLKTKANEIVISTPAIFQNKNKSKESINTTNLFGLLEKKSVATKKMHKLFTPKLTHNNNIDTYSKFEPSFTLSYFTKTFTIKTKKHNFEKLHNAFMNNLVPGRSFGVSTITNKNNSLIENQDFYLKKTTATNLQKRKSIFINNKHQELQNFTLKTLIDLKNTMAAQLSNDELETFGNIQNVKYTLNNTPSVRLNKNVKLLNLIIKKINEVGTNVTNNKPYNSQQNYTQSVARANKTMLLNQTINSNFQLYVNTTLANTILVFLNKSKSQFKNSLLFNQTAIPSLKVENPKAQYIHTTPSLLLFERQTRHISDTPRIAKFKTFYNIDNILDTSIFNKSAILSTDKIFTPESNTLLTSPNDICTTNISTTWSMQNLFFPHSPTRKLNNVLKLVKQTTTKTMNRLKKNKTQLKNNNLEQNQTNNSLEFAYQPFELHNVNVIKNINPNSSLSKRFDFQETLTQYLYLFGKDKIKQSKIISTNLKNLLKEMKVNVSHNETFNSSPDSQNFIYTESKNKKNVSAASHYYAVPNILSYTYQNYSKSHDKPALAKSKIIFNDDDSVNQNKSKINMNSQKNLTSLATSFENTKTGKNPLASNLLMKNILNFTYSQQIDLNVFPESFKSKYFKFSTSNENLNKMKHDTFTIFKSNLTLSKLFRIPEIKNTHNNYKTAFIGNSNFTKFIKIQPTINSSILHEKNKTKPNVTNQQIKKTNHSLFTFLKNNNKIVKQDLKDLKIHMTKYSNYLSTPALFRKSPFEKKIELKSNNSIKNGDNFNKRKINNVEIKLIDNQEYFKTDSTVRESKVLSKPKKNNLMIDKANIKKQFQPSNNHPSKISPKKLCQKNLKEDKIFDFSERNIALDINSINSRLKLRENTTKFEFAFIRNNKNTIHMEDLYLKQYLPYHKQFSHTKNKSNGSFVKNKNNNISNTPKTVIPNMRNQYGNQASTRKTKIVKYNTYRSDDYDYEISTSFNILRKRINNINSFLKKKNKHITRLPIGYVKNNNNFNLNSTNNGLIKNIVLDNKNIKLFVSTEKTKLFQVKEAPTDKNRNKIRTFHLTNLNKNIVTMNTNDFFAQRRFVTQRNYLKDYHYYPYKSQQIQTTITSMPKKYIIRPIFDNQINIVKTKYFRPKPLLVNKDDFYRKDFTNYRRSNKILLNEKHHFIKDILPKENLKSFDSVIERPSYLPPQTKPQFLRDRMASIRNYLLTSNDNANFQGSLNNEENQESVINDPLYLYRESGWYQEPLTTETTSIISTRRSRRTIFFLSPTIPYNRYF